MTCTHEITHLSSPNDVCLDHDESILYVCGGTFRRACCCFSFSNSAYGRIYKVELNRHDKIAVQTEGLNTLAGVEVVNGTVWSAQLFDIVKVDANASGKPTVVWEGNDSQDQVWLADNIDIFGDAAAAGTGSSSSTTLLCPAYSTISAKSVKKVLNRTKIMSAVLVYFQVATAISRGERIRTALRDPEVNLSFSNTYIQSNVPPAPVRLIFIDSATGKAAHYEIDLTETRSQHPSRTVKSRQGEVQGQRHFFNEQVTHASHLKSSDGQGFVACVNFEQPRILLLNDKAFRGAFTK
jgi:hypothetical protein